jgi:hypothetical protein
MSPALRYIKHLARPGQLVGVREAIDILADIYTAAEKALQSDAEIRIHVTRRQACLLGSLLEADLVERGVLSGDEDPPFPVQGDPWVPSEEENREDEKLLTTISGTIELADTDPPPGA